MPRIDRKLLSKKDNVDTHSKGVIQKALKRAFSPEFLNRIDDVIVFNSLDKEDINKIIDIEMDSLLKRIDTLGYTVKISEEAKDFIADKGFDAKFGARPLKRAIQKYFEDPLSEEIISAQIKEGDTIKVSLNKEKSGLNMKITKPKAKRKKDKLEK
jgi:ATP-dependent Clp protease ATP-binding subunit ClpC